MIMQFYRIQHMMIDDSTTKNTRLLDREFIPKTEHLDLNFLSKVQLNFGFKTFAEQRA